MPGRRRKANELARDRKRISSMYLRGVSQADIAEKTGLSAPTVSRVLTELHDRWLADAAGNHAQWVAVELARLAKLERTYWAAWLRSCRNRESTTAKKVETPGSGKARKTRTEASKRTEGRDGNPDFLAGVRACIRERCELLGLYAPKQVKHGGKLKLEHHEDYDLKKLTTAQLVQWRDLALAASTNGHQRGTGET